MSTNADELVKTLKRLLDRTDLHLAQVSKRTKISYSKLYRFKRENGMLSLGELEALSQELTGSTFINIKG